MGMWNVDSNNTNWLWSSSGSRWGYGIYYKKRTTEKRHIRSDLYMVWTYRKGGGQTTKEFVVFKQQKDITQLIGI